MIWVNVEFAFDWTGWGGGEERASDKHDKRLGAVDCGDGRCANGIVHP